MSVVTDGGAALICIMVTGLTPCYRFANKTAPAAKSVCH